MNDAFTRSPDVILDHFKVDPDRGLTSSQAKVALEKYGKNGTDISIDCRLCIKEGGQHWDELVMSQQSNDRSWH